MSDLSFEYPFQRAVITGMGVFAPLGMSLREFGDSVLKGLSSITKITRFDN